MRTLTTRTAAITLTALFMGCGGSSQPAPEMQPAPSGNEQQGTPQALSNADAGTQEPPAPATPAPPPVTVTAGERTAIPEGLRPRVAITAPRDNATLRTNSVEVRLRVTDWPAPQDGRHIHLILDDEPYRRIDDPSRPVRLENLAEGTHVLRAFPGWSTHESVKTDGAFVVSTFHIGRRTENFALNRTAPLLTYSRPKGEYNGADAERILLDFYLTNVPNLAADGHRVRYSIDGSTTGEISNWVPHFITNLPDGQHTISLELLAPNGTPVDNLYSRSERTITVNHAAQASGGHAHEGGAAPAPATPATPANP